MEEVKIIQMIGNKDKDADLGDIDLGDAFWGNADFGNFIFEIKTINGVEK